MSPENTEVNFSFNELFFSRTDARGVIISGNSVFKRISEFSWDELLGKPHNIIRHPKMPRAVFFLLWKTIQSQKPIAAYVQNKSKSGKFYWVFALALPIKDGYISIRLKPSSTYFQAAQSAYSNLHELEIKQKLKPDESAQVLMDVIGELGFHSYQDFMTAALIEELTLRGQKMNGHEQTTIMLENLKTLKDLTHKMWDRSESIFKSFKQNALVPLNLTVQAAKLERRGDPITVVANKYTDLTQEIAAEFSHFKNCCDRSKLVVMETQFELAAMLLQREVSDFFSQENDHGPISVHTEASILTGMVKNALENSTSALRNLKDEFSRIIKTCQDLKQIASGLEIVRLTGKIEVSRLGEQSYDLLHFIDELLTFKTFLDQAIDHIESYGHSIATITVDLSTQLTSNQ
jgi:hypothetical protein